MSEKFTSSITGIKLNPIARYALGFVPIGTGLVMIGQGYMSSKGAFADKDIVKGFYIVGVIFLLIGLFGYFGTEDEDIPTDTTNTTNTTNTTTDTTTSSTESTTSPTDASTLAEKFSLRGGRTKTIL